MNTEKYVNTVSYPEHIKKPFLKSKHTAEEVKQYAEELKIYEKNLSIYREAQKNYNIEENRLLELFKQDAFKELGIENNPKRNKVWEIAYSEGHSDGLTGIWYEMEKLAELLVED